MPAPPTPTDSRAPLPRRDAWRHDGYHRSEYNSVPVHLTERRDRRTYASESERRVKSRSNDKRQGHKSQGSDVQRRNRSRDYKSHRNYKSDDSVADRYSHRSRYGDARKKDEGRRSRSRPSKKSVAAIVEDMELERLSLLSQFLMISLRCSWCLHSYK